MRNEKSRASVAKWLAHLPFTSEAIKVNALPKVVGFPRVLRFPPTGKVDRVG
jgi:hypothetical protein